jgi:hypothetical protein
MSKKPAPESPKNNPPDPAAAKKAYETMSPRMAALAKEDLALLNIDGQAAAIIALSVSRFLAEPEPRARFALLDAKTFDPAHLGDLGTIALAVSHAYVELQSARAQTTEAKLPVALVDKATKVKERMLECAEYLFKRHEKLSKEVASIRADSGYRDTASDLLRLAKIYEDKKSTVEKDPLNYRDTDAADARTHAQEILTELGNAQSAEEQRCVAAMTRAWTLLRDTYAEVQSAGQFLYRHEEPEEKFPSLYASSGAGRPKKAKEPAPPATGEGGEGGGGK